MNLPPVEIFLCFRLYKCCTYSLMNVNSYTVTSSTLLRLLSEQSCVAQFFILRDPSSSRQPMCQTRFQPVAIFQSSSHVPSSRSDHWRIVTNKHVNAFCSSEPVNAHDQAANAHDHRDMQRSLLCHLCDGTFLSTEWNATYEIRDPIHLNMKLRAPRTHPDHSLLSHCS